MRTARPVVNSTIGAGADNFLGERRIIHPNLPKKLLCSKLSLYKFAGYVAYCSTLTENTKLPEEFVVFLYCIFNVFSMT